MYLKCIASKGQFTLFKFYIVANIKAFVSCQQIPMYWMKAYLLWFNNSNLRIPFIYCKEGDYYCNRDFLLVSLKPAFTL